MPIPDELQATLSTRRLALTLAPIVALTTWWMVAPADRLASPESKYRLPSLVYDEYDLSAMALRGLNAHLGRRAGAIENPDWLPAARFAAELRDTGRPLDERYFLEYPHAALLIFRLGFVNSPRCVDDVPAAVLDGDYHNIANYHPTNDREREIWRSLARARQAYVVLFALGFVVLIAVLEWGYGADLAGGSLFLLLPAALFFSLNRYDVLPALATALGFAFLGRRWIAASAFCFAVGMLLKVYPILFVPMIWRFLGRRNRASWVFLGVFAATGLLAFAPLALGVDLKELMAPYRFQLLRPPEFGLTIYGALLPERLAAGAGGSVFRLGTLALALVCACATPIPDLASLLRRCGMVLLIFAGLAVFWSPQWLLWLAPVLLPLVGRHRRLAYSLSALDLISYATFPFWWLVLPELLAGHPLVFAIGNVLRLARFLVGGVLTVQLLYPEFQYWRTTARGGSA